MANIKRCNIISSINIDGIISITKIFKLLQSIHIFKTIYCHMDLFFLVFKLLGI